MPTFTSKIRLGGADEVDRGREGEGDEGVVVKVGDGDVVKDGEETRAKGDSGGTAVVTTAGPPTLRTQQTSQPSPVLPQLPWSSKNPEELVQGKNPHEPFFD